MNFSIKHCCVPGSGLGSVAAMTTFQRPIYLKKKKGLMLEFEMM